MKQEEKELLTKVVCSGIPYHLKVNYTDKVYDVLGYTNNKLIIVLPFMSILEAHPVETCKPYLRPMSSMTNEERHELQELCDMYDPYHDTDPYDDWGIHILTQHVHSDVPKTVITNFSLVLDWLNSHHFDYRGLIRMGLALEAPEGMYKKGGEK